MWKQNLVGYTWRFCKFTPHGKPDLQYTVSSVMYFHDFKKAHFVPFQYIQCQAVVMSEWQRDNWLLCHFVYTLDVMLFCEERGCLDSILSTWFQKGRFTNQFLINRFRSNDIYNTRLSSTAWSVSVCVCVSVFITVSGGNYFHKLPSVHKRKFPIQYICKVILLWWGY